MNADQINKGMASVGFEDLGNLEFTRRLPNTLQKVSFSESLMDSSFHIEANMTIKLADRTLDYGGPICAGAIDYLQTSFSEKCWKDFEPTLNKLILPWFDALNESQSTISDLSNNDLRTENLKYSLVSTSDGLLSVLSRTNQILCELGFICSHHDSALRYVRKFNEVFHVVELDPISEGVFLAARACAWMPEVQILDECKSDSIPSDFETLMYVNGGFFHDKGQIDSNPVLPINIAQLDSVTMVDRQLSESIKNVENIFFQSIVSRKDLINSFMPEYKRSSYFSHLFN